MKYLIGTISSFIAFTIISQFDIDRFLMGWVSCLFFYIGKEIYEDIFLTKPK